MTEVNLLEMNCEEVLDVTGGSITIGAVISAIITISTVVGGAYVQLEKKAVKDAYNEAYRKEMLRLNMENPIPYGDLLREYYAQ